MKVSQLEIGMLVEPTGDSEFFRLHPNTEGQLPYLTVRAGIWRSRYSSAIRDQVVVYLGNRKEAFVPQKEFGWSNRFVLVDGKVAAMDPAAWKRVKKVKYNDNL
jgi:hypothetical protein